MRLLQHSFHTSRNTVLNTQLLMLAAYERNVRELVRTMRDSLDAEAMGASEFEVRAWWQVGPDACHDECWSAAPSVWRSEGHVSVVAASNWASLVHGIQHQAAMMSAGRPIPSSTLTQQQPMFCKRILYSQLCIQKHSDHAHILQQTETHG